MAPYRMHNSFRVVSVDLIHTNGAVCARNSGSILLGYYTVKDIQLVPERRKFLDC